MFKAWGGEVARNKARRLKDQYTEMSTDSEHGDESMSVGDYVMWENGGAHGKIDEIIREGCTTRGKGDMEVCAEDDDPAVVVEVYDDETGESKDIMVRHKMSTLQSWNGPSTDSLFADATTIEDTIRYDGTKAGSLDESRLPTDEYQMHYVFDGETKTDSSFPLVDADGNLRGGNVASAFRFRSDADDQTLLLSVLSSANDAFDDRPIDENSLFTTMSDNNDPDDAPNLNIDSVIESLSLDALVERHDGVAELQSTLDAKDDTIAVLEDEKADLETTLEDAEETIQAFEDGERQPKAELVGEITEMTDAFDEETLLELDREELQSKKATVEEIAEDTSVSASTPEGPTTDDGDGHGGPESTDEPMTDSGRTIADDHRSWADD
jgi:hypothetical protein